MAKREFKKILLINPPGRVLILKDGIPAARKHSFPPIGLAYLGATLRNAGYEVSIVDMLVEGYEVEIIKDNHVIYGLTAEMLLEKIEEIKPDVVGMSVMFSSKIYECLNITSEIKKRYPDIVTVYGGAHVSGAPIDTVQHPSVDYALIREADLSIVDFMNFLNGTVDIKDVENLYYKVNGEVLNTITATPVVKGNGWEQYKRKDAGVPVDLDALPFPAWDLLPMERYWDKEVRVAGGDVISHKYLVVISSRGCPWACHFCTSPTISGWKAYRKRSDASVIAEIKHFKEIYDIKEVMFDDDNFFTDKKRTLRLIKALGKAFPDTYFSNPGGTEINALDNNVIDILAENRFYRVNLAIEVGDPEVQKMALDKKVPLERLHDLVAYLKSKSIETRAMYIIGIPGETRAQRQRTLDLVRTLDVDDFYISIATPLRGTVLFDHVVENGLFIEGADLNDIGFGKAAVKMVDDTTSEELEDVRRVVWKESFEIRRRKIAQNTIVTDAEKRTNEVEEYENAGYLFLKKNKTPTVSHS